MISTIEFEKCMAAAGILGVVISKFCYEKKSCPIILLKVDKSLEVGFHYSILSFGLSVYL